MGIELNTPPNQAVIDRRLESEQKQQSDENATVWAFVWTLFAFKIATGIAIFWAAGWTKDAGSVLGATHWFWIMLPAVVVGGPIMFRYRLLKVRRRREALRRAEWMIR